MKDIVLVCHYFPPQQNVGVRRVLFWANYFSNKGYSVTIVTTKKIEAGSLEGIVSPNVSIIEFGVFNDSVRASSDGFDSSNGNLKNSRKKRTDIINKVATFSRNFKQKYVNRLFGQLIDNRLPACLLFCFRIKFSIGSVAKLISQLPSKDTIVISTAPPWPVHLVGSVLASKIKAKRIVDYRDPFSGNHIFSSKLNSLEKYIDHKLCSKAELISTVSPSWVKYYSKLNKNTVLLRNGFDSSYVNLDTDISMEESLIVKSSLKPIRLSYFGSIEVEERVPKQLLAFVSKDPSVEMHFYGNCSYVEEYLIKVNSAVPNNIFLHGFVQYSDSIRLMHEADINVVCESFGDSPSHRGLIPTKIYEYLSAMKPILVIAGKNSDMHDVCKQSGLLYYSVDTDSFNFHTIFNEKYVSEFRYAPNIQQIANYTRQSVALELEKIIEEM